jgi:hypothetical protein
MLTRVAGAAALVLALASSTVLLLLLDMAAMSGCG